MCIALARARFGDTDLKYMGSVYEPPEPLFSVHLDLSVAHIHTPKLILQLLSIIWSLVCHLRPGWVSRIVHISSARSIKPADNP
jgi:hypothetical protein